MTEYQAAKLHQEAIESSMRSTKKVLESLGGGSGPMGLTPDSIRANPEYLKAKRDLDTAFASLRKFNSVFIKRFAKELREERRARRSKE